MIGRQTGIEDRGGHKQALVCFPSPLFYARPTAGTSRETDRGRRGLRLSDVRRRFHNPRHFPLSSHAVNPPPYRVLSRG